MISLVSVPINTTGTAAVAAAKAKAMEAVAVAVVCILWSGDLFDDIIKHVVISHDSITSWVRARVGFKSASDIQGSFECGVESAGEVSGKG